MANFHADETNVGDARPLSELNEYQAYLIAGVRACFLLASEMIEDLYG